MKTHILRDTIHQTAVSAGLGPSREVGFLLPGSNSRPADVLIRYWTAGKDTAYNVTVINPLQVYTMRQASITPGHALTVAFDRKRTAAAKDCQRQGIAVIPLAAEPLGAQLANNGGQAQIEETSSVDVILGAQYIGTSLLSGF